jgi:hypothetical protein
MMVLKPTSVSSKSATSSVTRPFRQPAALADRFQELFRAGNSLLAIPRRHRQEAAFTRPVRPPLSAASMDVHV